MKTEKIYDLKNRPPDYALGQKGIKWFEDFENQEQERLRIAEVKADFVETEDKSTFWDGYIVAKKEILGTLCIPLTAEILKERAKKLYKEAQVIHKETEKLEEQRKI